VRPLLAALSDQNSHPEARSMATGNIIAIKTPTLDTLLPG